jgi:steroid delta-isomerase-like uncharacterized protein
MPMQSPTPSPTPSPAGTPQQLVEAAYLAVIERDMDRLLEIFSGECEFIDSTQPDPVQGRAAFEEYMAETWRVFPDFHPENAVFTAEGNSVAAELELVGTHAADFLGVPASGAVVRWRAAAFYTIDPVTSTIVREAYYYDADSLRGVLAAAHPADGR